MILLRWMLALLAWASAWGMADAAVRILGPDLSFPPRGWWFDLKWTIFHAFPCILLGIFAVRSCRGDRAVTIGLAVVGTLIVVPGLLIAWNEAGPGIQRESRLYGIRSLLAALLQYLAVGAVGILLLWRSRVRQRALKATLS